MVLLATEKLRAAAVSGLSRYTYICCITEIGVLSPLLLGSVLCCCGFVAVKPKADREANGEMKIHLREASLVAVYVDVSGYDGCFLLER